MVARWVPLVASAAAIAVTGTLVVVLLAPRGADVASPSPSNGADAVEFTVADQSVAPQLAAVSTGPGAIGVVDPQWVTDVAAATGIPNQAVLAYAAAVIEAENNFPGCGLGWNTLAGIGYAESDHGRHGGATFEPNGHVAPKIFGIPLDGTTTDLIPDSDGGEFDETAEIDRAIGPMQLIPQTWRSWPSDGNGDLVPDPHNIYDAALASANYLCHATTSFTTDDGFAGGVAAYNSAPSYAVRVATAAQNYFEDTR